MSRLDACWSALKALNSTILLGKWRLLFLPLVGVKLSIILHIKCWSLYSESYGGNGWNDFIRSRTATDPNINKNYIKLQWCYGMIVTHPVGIKIELALISALAFNCFFLLRFLVLVASDTQINSRSVPARKKKEEEHHDYDLTFGFHCMLKSFRVLVC